MAAHYDVLIVGGGIAGLSLASALAGSCSVALVEAEQELAYHTSSRSARQLIPSYGPRRGPGTDRPDPGTDGGPGRGTARTCPVAAELYAHRHRGSRPRGGQRPHAAHHPCRALELCPALVPGVFLRRRPGHRVLRLQRPAAAGRPPAAGRGRRRGHHHRRPGAFRPAAGLGLGDRRRAGSLRGRCAGQRRRRLGRRTRRHQRRGEARAAAVPAHRGDCRRRTFPARAQPHGGGSGQLVLLPPRGRRTC